MPKKILIVDDEPDMMKIFRFHLQRDGYEVCSAVTGEECIRMAVTEEPDLILLDLLLPGMSGLEVARRLKEDEKTRHIPVVMVTASIGEETKAKGLERGARYLITKPFDPENLLAEVKKAIKKPIK